MKNILVFPCGSEIGLEIHRAVRYSTHFHLIGASSVDDHGRFVYEDYEGGLPFITDQDFLPALKALVQKRAIQAIYPAMDSVIALLKNHEAELGCQIVAAPSETTTICLAKSRTYQRLQGVVKTPVIIPTATPDPTFPLFGKPDIGYGSRGAKKINNKAELDSYHQEHPEAIICEYLPGVEYTVDCFTDHDGQLLFVGPRQRCRIMNGISVNTKPVADPAGHFAKMAKAINGAMSFCGAWFFQVKEDAAGQLTLLEVASRFGGSSGLFRARGINFPLMSIFTTFGIPVAVLDNNYAVEMDRALDNKYKLSLEFNEVFVDFDDCLLLNKMEVNTELVEFLYRCLNRQIPLRLITRHPDGADHLQSLLNKFRLSSLFDEVILLPKQAKKSTYIHNQMAIFIDDSFAERQDVATNCQIAVFSPDMVGALL